jgi:hypothetical protein
VAVVSGARPAKTREKTRGARPECSSAAEEDDEEEEEENKSNRLLDAGEDAGPETAPNAVCVLPAPEAPYTKQLACLPARAASTSALPTA